MVVELLIKVAVVWLSFWILVVATGWYFGAIIKQFFPDWWRRTVIDNDPDFRAQDENDMGIKA